MRTGTCPPPADAVAFATTLAARPQSLRGASLATYFGTSWDAIGTRA